MRARITPNTNTFYAVLNISVDQAAIKWYADRMSKQLSSLNPFLYNAPFLCPLETWENSKVERFETSLDQGDCRHVQPSQETKWFYNQRFWYFRDNWGDQICKWSLHKSRKSFRQTQTTTFVTAFVFADCFKWKHEYSHDMKINIFFLWLLSIYLSHVLIGENRVLEIKFDR